MAGKNNGVADNAHANCAAANGHANGVAGGGRPAFPPATPSPTISLVRIDKTHKWWIIITAAIAAAAVLLHLFLGWNTPNGLSGGTRVGLWFGVAGSLLMLFVGSLSAHRRLAAVRWIPRRWLGRRQDWLRAHLWLGLLSVVLVLVHSNYRVGGPLTLALWVVLAITTLSGIVGAALQHALPRALTTTVPDEAPYEQIPHLCRRMREDADEAHACVTSLPPRAAKEFTAVYEQAREFLGEKYLPRSPFADPLGAETRFGRVRTVPGIDPALDALARLELLCRERRSLGEQERMHAWLHYWLLAHVPITLALLILGVAHAVLAVYW